MFIISNMMKNLDFINIHISIVTFMYNIELITKKHINNTSLEYLQSEIVKYNEIDQ